MSLEGIRAWLLTRGGVDAFREQTTADVVTRHILPATTPGLALAAMLPLYHTAPPTVHVCHAWGGKFLKLLAALEAWEGGLLAQGALPSPPHYWLDIFTLPLHSPPALAVEHLTGVLAPGIAAIGKSLLVLDPEHPLPLRRTWCLYELGAALSAAPIDIALSPLDTERLHKTLSTPGGLEGLVEQLITPLDLPSSEAGRGEDKRRLLKAFREGPVSPAATLTHLARCLALWLVAASQGPLRAATSAIARTPLQAGLARLQLRVLQDPQGAEEALLAVLQCMEPILGEAHPRAVRARMDLGAACAAQGKVGEAEGHYRAALAGAAAGAVCWGSGGGGGGSGAGAGAGSGGGEGGGSAASKEAAAAEIERAGAQVALGDCLVAQGKLGEAELLFRQALNFRRGCPALGVGHGETLAALLKLGLCVGGAGGGRGQEAQALLTEALEAGRKHAGEGAPLTLQAGEALGQWLGSSSSSSSGSSSSEERAGFWAALVLARRRGLGDAHPATLLALVRLGEARHAEGDAAAAAACLEEAVAGGEGQAREAVALFCRELRSRGKGEEADMFQELLG